MRKIAVLLLLTIISCFAMAQNIHIDSLKNVLKNAQYDNDRVDIYNNLSLGYSDLGLIDEAHEYASKSFLLAQKNKYRKGLATAYYSYGRLNQYKGDLHLALEFHEKALPYFYQLGDLKSIGFVILNMGICNCSLKQYNDAIILEKKALQTFTKIKNKQGIAYANLNISIAYNLMNMPDISFKHIQITEKMCKEIGDSKGVSYAYSALGGYYTTIKQYDKALDYYQKCVELKKTFHDFAGAATVTNLIGKVYLSMNDLKKARQSFYAAMDFVSSSSIKARHRFYEGLYLVDYQEGNYKSAIENYKKYVVYRDSVFKSETGKNLLKSQSKIDEQRRNMDIELLKIEKEKDKALNEKEGKAMFIMLFSAIIILVMVGFFSYFVYNRFMLSQQQQKLITHQNELIEVQIKKIKDSLLYASRIQQAMMTNEAYVKEHLKKDCFILYQPKDVVSGDFYWALEHQHKLYFITANCTGNGVPGAFVSLLNISFLNEQIVGDALLSPAEILFNLRKAIVNAMTINGGEVFHVGMDCVLCQFDLETLELNFAAANNFLWVYRNGERIAYRGDKMAVGVTSDLDKPFTNYTIQLEKGDTVYTFTDGIPNQIGGDHNAKYNTGNFAKLLASVQNLPLAEQKKYISDTLNHWKGAHEQTDDVLLVGISV